MSYIGRRDLTLLLIGLDPERDMTKGLGGITRLQKFLYLLEKEENIAPQQDGFEFTAYKAGPYSSKLYDDLEFLENLGLIESEVTSETTDAEAAEVDLLSFEELMGDSADNIDDGPVDGLGAADAYEERRFKLTKTGIDKLQNFMEEKNNKHIIDGVQRIKSKYGKFSLQDLLYYVYNKYPEMVIESEIKEKVLRRH